MRWLLFLFILIEFSEIHAQEKAQLKIEFSLSDFNTVFELESLRFYITNIRLENNKEVVHTEKESYHLIDITEYQNSIEISVPDNLQFNKVIFDLGVDSVTNVSGIYSGDLDPTKGMYWTWQSGYINFKLEGKHPESTGRNNEVQFHLGGYLPGQLSIQHLVFNCPNQSYLNIQFDIDAFLKSIDFSNEHTIMSPGKRAVSMSEQIKTHLKSYE